MTFKVNIGTKEGASYKIETESEGFIDKEIGDKILGEDFSDELKGYEFEITGTSDTSGFTGLKNVSGSGLRKVLLSYEKGMKKRPRRELKKKRGNYTPKGLRLRKTVRGKIISSSIVQINLKTLKIGAKPFSEIFKPKDKGAQ